MTYTSTLFDYDRGARLVITAETEVDMTRLVYEQLRAWSDNASVNAACDEIVAKGEFFESFSGKGTAIVTLQHDAQRFWTELCRMASTDNQDVCQGDVAEAPEA